MILRRIGLIVNPTAGGGKGLDIGRKAVQALGPIQVLAGEGEMGAAALYDLPCSVITADWSAHTGTARTTWLAQRFASEGVDMLVVVGGDGTLADVAFALSHVEGQVAQVATPLLGIGAGSANVGPLITCQGTEVHRLNRAHLVTREIDGLIVSAYGKDLGLGFNDVVIGHTVLATVNGQVTDVDAAQKFRGLSIPRDPEPVWTERTRIIRTSLRGETLVAQGEEVATLIVGLSDERFYGKAIAGGIILSSLIDAPGGCLVCNHLLVRTRMDELAYHRAEPVVSRFVSLDEDQSIEGWGLRPGSALCADGNPLLVMQEQDRFQIRIRRGLVKSVQIEES